MGELILVGSEVLAAVSLPIPLTGGEGASTGWRIRRRRRLTSRRAERGKQKEGPIFSDGALHLPASHLLVAYW